MKVTAIIKSNSRQCKETFDIPEGANVEEYIMKIIDNFNATLKPGEKKRTFVKIVKVNKVTTYSDFKLAMEIISARQKQIAKINEYYFDEIHGDSVPGTIKYFKKLQYLEEMLNYIHNMRTVFRYELLEELLEEGMKRGWKTIRKVKNVIKKLNKPLKATSVNEDNKFDFKTKEGIAKWLDFMEIEDYTINNDLTVDVNGYVELGEKDLAKIPIQFGKVNGYFNCYDNNLTSLEGAPKYVGRNFYCGDNNELASLEGAPKYVGGSFWCGDIPKLTSLEGAPERVDGDFTCYNNELTSLDGAPEYVGGYFDCRNNPNLNYEYLNDFDFSFVKGKIRTDFIDINNKWNNK